MCSSSWICKLHGKFDYHQSTKSMNTITQKIEIKSIRLTSLMQRYRWRRKWLRLWCHPHASLFCFNFELRCECKYSKGKIHHVGGYSSQEEGMKQATQISMSTATFWCPYQWFILPMTHKSFTSLCASHMFLSLSLSLFARIRLYIHFLILTKSRIEISFILN